MIEILSYMSQMGHISTDGGDDCECEQKEFLEKKTHLIFFVQDN